MNRPRLLWLSVCLLAVFAAGALAIFARNFDGARVLRNQGEANYALPSGAAVDEAGRLRLWPGKKQVPCPPMDGQTAVLLILGQSNAANHGGERLVSGYGSKLVNFHAGSCFVAESPLLGSTGQGGEPWTAVANLLVESGVSSNVILVPVAVSGSRIARWIPGGDLHGVLTGELANLRTRYTPTHVLWLQGESDFARQTSAGTYRTALRVLVQSLRAASILAPVFVAVASKCSERPLWNAGNDIAIAQRESADAELDIYEGPDLDGILSTEDRYDGCHLSGHGLMKVARAWASAIQRHRNKISSFDWRRSSRGSFPLISENILSFLSAPKISTEGQKG